MKKLKKEENSAENEEESSVYIFDRREGNNPEMRVKLGGIFKFGAFRSKVCEVLKIPKKDEFVLVNTNREQIVDDKSYEELVEDKETIYLLKSLDQELTAPTQERVVFIPHYDTLVKSGMYEYYASEGQNPLPFAFAELIDNALAATACNEGDRKVEVKLMFDDTTGKHAVCVMDNGGGMTPRELNNWAIYRLSKFNRKTSKMPSEKEVPRSLNSDISYFGVGGKQAIFFIGNATRMITKTKDCSDVHELCISKEEFERREKNKESIYSGTIMNRRPGDSSHVASDEDSISKLIKEEASKDSFTAVVITGVSAQHSLYLKAQFDQWCQQLAHIYHYYLHGPKGNASDAKRTDEEFKSIDISVVLYEKGKQTKIKALHTVVDDLQTQYIRTSASTLEFRAHVENTGCIEGVLRYHPFLYDRETFPMNDAEAKLADDMNQGTAVDDPAEVIEKDTNGPRGYRPVFECYWNGRLIPYTAIDSLEWCQPPKKRTIIPQECYNRFSGVLWTNDAFQVSTNKLTFMDLEVKLKDKSATFNRVVTGQEQRVQISKAFQDWIKECHENHDKQIKFSSFQGQVKRPEFFHKHRQSPWSVFNAIEWDGKIFKAGQLIRTTRTIPYFCGTVKRFLLYGDHEGDVFATGGEMEIVQEPVALYGETKAFPLAKLDRTLTVTQVKKFVEEEECKLPSRLTIEWPEGNKLEKNSKIPAGTTIGAMKVDIVNGKGEPINKLPGDRRKLLVEMKVIWHDGDQRTDKVITNLVCQHGGKNWPYWFRKMENTTQLGAHTLLLQVVVSDTSTAPTMKGLPSHAIKFTVTEAKPDKFTFGMLDNPLRIGVPFQIPLNLFDEFGNPTTFTENITPKLSGSGIDLSFNGVASKKNCLYLKNVVAVGTVPSHAGKDFTLKVQLPGLEEDSQSLKIRLLPGPAKKLLVAPPSSEITIENGDVPEIHVQVHDEAGNITVSPNQNVICKFTGQPNLPTYTGDCSSSGKAILTGSNISLKLSNNQPIRLKARIELQNHKEVTAVDKTIIVIPSRRAIQIQVFHVTEDKQKVKLEDGEDIHCAAGKTISGLSFKILDEGNRELDIDTTLINKLKLNWVQKPPKDLLKDGLLPDVKAPTGLAESKFCQINMVGSVGLDFSFNIKPTPDEPFMLKSSCINPKLRHGEALQADIIAIITDKHGNKVTKLPPGALKLFHISAPGLKEKEVGIGVSQNGSIVIKNIKFDKGPLGPKELTITWQKLKCYLRLEVVAGPPAKLSLVNIDNTEAISVFNNTAISVPLTVQLCDEMGNPTDESDIKIILLTDKGVKLVPSPSQVKTNAKGRASFGQPVISASRGVYSIRIKALCPPRLTLEAPVINIRVQPDPTKPVLLNVTFDSKAVCQVGELLPVVTASVVAEDETVLKSASGKDLVLKIWHTKDGPPSDKPPPRATTLYPSRKTPADKEGVFAFRDLKVPDVSGPYCMIVQYGPGGSLCLTSKILTFTAEAGPPVRLEPEAVPPTPTVSNTSRLSGRCLVKTLKLNLKDKFDNNAGQNLQGKVIIRVTSPIDGIDEIPSLANASRHNQLEVALVKGMATVQNLHIQENTNGKDGQEYLVNFQALLSAKSVPHPVPPFTLAFLFYNDVRKQQQMAQLTKERDHLFETIRTYRSLFDTTRQLIQEMRVSVHEAAQQEQKLREELKKQQIADLYLQSPQCVDTFLAALSKRRQEIGIAPRRLCSLNPGPQGDPEILGKVAHLAQVENDEVARVLSWHMASDMDCVVTLTTAKAKEVYNESNGQQQVLPLDSIYKQRLPEWNRPLPHVRSGPRNYQPPGNPVYARDKLIFPKETENCKIVFGMLLGDTIILDNLDCANKYRQDVVKHTHCPTILTTTGDRIRSNGKFGGLQNKAPVLERMRGAVFAAPVPTTYRTLTSKIEQLQAFKQAQIKHQQAKADLELQLQQGQTPQMKVKHQECQEAENQLRMIEERLGMTPTQYEMPASPATMLHTELNTPLSSQSLSARRTQASTATPTGRPMVNGSVAQNRTRRASPLNSEDPRSKRPRRN